MFFDSFQNGGIAILFILCSYGLSITKSHEFHVRLMEYGHPSNILSNDKPCDVNSECDPTFIICIKSRKSERKCDYLKQATPKGHFRDTNHIVFENMIGEMKNLFSVSLPHNKPIDVDPWIVIQVHDDDSERKNIGFFSSTLTGPGEYNLSISKSRKSKPFVLIKYWYSCHKNWFGDKCQTYCLPKNNTGCDNLMGKLICQKGFMKSSSNDESCEKDPCLFNSPCKFSSECVSLPRNNYLCECPPHLQGQHCEDVKRPCDKEICLNGGKCWMDDEKRPLCECPPQYMGEICDQPRYGDLQDLGSICSAKNDRSVRCENGGKCLSKPWIARDICFCPQGFGGERCELNVTWPSSNYDEMRLLNDLTKKYDKIVLTSFTTMLMDFDLTTQSNLIDNDIRETITELETSKKMVIHSPEFKRALASLMITNQDDESAIGKLHFILLVTGLASISAIGLVIAVVIFCQRQRSGSHAIQSVEVRYSVTQNLPAVPTPNDKLTVQNVEDPIEDEYLLPESVYELVDEQ